MFHAARRAGAHAARASTRMPARCFSTAVADAAAAAAAAEEAAQGVGYTEVLRRLDDLEARLLAVQPMFGAVEGLGAEEFSRYVTQWEYFTRRKQSLIALEDLIPSDGVATADHVINFLRYLYHEVPIRFSHRGNDLDSLPYGLSHMKSVRAVKSWYFQSFVHMRRLKEPKTIEDCVKLLPTLRGILERHSRTLEHLAKGIYDLKRALRPTADLTMLHSGAEPVDRHAQRRGNKIWMLSNLPKLQDFLNDFNESRIGTRFLLAHAMELVLQVGVREGWLKTQEAEGFRYSTFQHDSESFVGLVCQRLDAKKVVDLAAAQVSAEAEKVYGTSPKIAVHAAGSVEEVVFPPLYLNTMTGELLKNSVRAVVEKHGRYGCQTGEPINVTVCVSDKKNLSVRVEDSGGGIKRSLLPLTQSYLYTTATPAYIESEHSLDVPAPPNTQPRSSLLMSASSPFAGYGFGLPITKCIAHYFGGDFQLLSQEGYGTSAYLFLQPAAQMGKKLP